MESGGLVERAFGGMDSRVRLPALSDARSSINVLVAGLAGIVGLLATRL